MMVTTIQLSPYHFVQGTQTATLPGGRVAVSVDGRDYVGEPVNRGAQGRPQRTLALVSAD